MSAVTSTVNAVSALAIAGYIGAVALNGNTSALVIAAKQDVGYLEFLIAAAILKVAIDNKTLRPYVLPLTVVGVIALLIQGFTISGAEQHKGTSSLQIFRERIAQFGAGNTSLFGLFGLTAAK